MMETCPLCAGTRFILCGRSWFITDGYRREKCHLCGGSGEIKRRSVNKRGRFLRGWIQAQERFRGRVAEWRGLKPQVSR